MSDCLHSIRGTNINRKTHLVTEFTTLPVHCSTNKSTSDAYSNRQKWFTENCAWYVNIRNIYSETKEFFQGCVIVNVWRWKNEHSNITLPLNFPISFNYDFVTLVWNLAAICYWQYFCLQKWNGFLTAKNNSLWIQSEFFFPLEKHSRKWVNSNASCIGYVLHTEHCACLYIPEYNDEKTMTSNLNNNEIYHRQRDHFQKIVIIGG